MAYAALVSLTNTIDRFLNSNVYSISVEEKQQIASLLEYVTPFQDFLDKFPDKFKSLEERMREVANEAEDILEYLVLEKVFLSSDEESELHDELDRGTVIKDISLKLENMWKESGQDFPDDEATDNSLKGRIRNVVNEAKKIDCFLEWETNHIRFRDKWRFLPAEFAMFKSRLHFINHLKKMGSEIDSIMAEATAVKNNNSDKAASSSGVVCNLVLGWDTPQLRHVHFHGTICFEDPNETTLSLESLQTLSYVSHSNCTESILKKIPNLKRLKIDCSGGGHHEDAACLNDLVHLHRLEKLKVYAGCWVGDRPKHYKISYPSMLKKLSLKDLRLPWSHMIVVGSLPNLQVLKLKSCTWVDGDTWETIEGAFPALEVLLIG